MKEIWLVEYSPIQKAIHIDPIDKILSTNMRNIINGVSPGYVPIYTATTHEEAQRCADLFLEYLRSNAQKPF